jgi:hypothetical protein
MVQVFLQAAEGFSEIQGLAELVCGGEWNG